MDNLYSAPLR